MALNLAMALTRQFLDLSDIIIRSMLSSAGWASRTTLIHYHPGHKSNVISSV
jgi:hypothetical protein